MFYRETRKIRSNPCREDPGAKLFLPFPSGSLNPGPTLPHFCLTANLTSFPTSAISTYDNLPFMKLLYQNCFLLCTRRRFLDLTYVGLMAEGLGIVAPPLANSAQNQDVPPPRGKWQAFGLCYWLLDPWDYIPMIC